MRVNSAQIRLVLVCCVATVAGCSNEADHAKSRYEIAKRSGDLREICKQSRELAQAYLNLEDEPEYKLARLDAEIDCQRAANSLGS
jgi:hypothetical protein